jgi:hypothetical protein
VLNYSLLKINFEKILKLNNDHQALKKLNTFDNLKNQRNEE